MKTIEMFGYRFKFVVPDSKASNRRFGGGWDYHIGVIWTDYKEIIFYFLIAYLRVSKIKR